MTDNGVATLQLRSGPVEVTTMGAGPPILFVHGLLVNGRLWARTADGLAADFRCVIPNLPLGSHTKPMLPNADLSPTGLARLIADVMDEMDLRDVTLVGNDTGGALCQIVATRHPERLARLVLTNCDAFENFLPPAFRPFQWVGHVKGLPWVTAQLFRPRFAQAGVLKLLAHTKIEPDTLRGFARPFIDLPLVRRDVTKVLKGIDKRYTLEAAEELRSFDKPVLLAWGRDDRFFKPKYAERLVALVPDGRIRFIEGSKTFVPVDKPDQLAQAIAEFAG